MSRQPAPVGHISGPALDRRLGISRSTRWRWIAQGYLPKPIRLGPKCLRWVVEEVEALERQAKADRGVGQP